MDVTRTLEETKAKLRWCHHKLRAANRCGNYKASKYFFGMITIGERRLHKLMHAQKLEKIAKRKR